MAPSVEIVWLTVALTGPERTSVQDQFTVTSVVIHPFELGAGVELTNAITGIVLSSFIVSAVAFVVSPAVFVQEPLKTVPVVSVVWD